MHYAQTFEATAPRIRTGPGHKLVSVLWLLGIGGVWWAVTRRQIDQAGFDAVMGASGAPAMSLGWLAASSVFGRFASVGCESLFYWAWWRSFGAGFRFARFFVVVASLSLIDAGSDTLQMLIRDAAPGLARWLAPVLGAGLASAPGAHASALGGAFATFGLCALLRIALTAWAQARETGRSIGLPLLVTLAGWLVTRLALWWGLDLARGMSPLS